MTLYYQCPRCFVTFKTRGGGQVFCSGQCSHRLHPDTLMTRRKSRDHFPYGRCKRCEECERIDREMSVDRRPDPPEPEEKP